MDIDYLHNKPRYPSNIGHGYFQKCDIKKNCYCDSSNTSPYSKYNKNPWDWSFIDTFFCLCLHERHDRFIESSLQFHKVGLCKHVLYYRCEKDTLKDLELLNLDKKWKGIAGIWESVRYVSSYANRILHSNCNLVMEDDIIFSPQFTPDKLLMIRNHINRIYDDYDVYYIGCLPYIGFPISQNLFRCKAVQTHCHIQSNRFMNTIYNTPFTPSYITYMSYIDVWISLYSKQYTIYPIMAIQSESDSSLQSSRNTIIAFFITLCTKYSYEVSAMMLLLIPFILLLFLLYYIDKHLCL